LKVLVRCGDYIQRAGGTIWGLTSYVESNKETTQKFIRAIAKAIMYFRDNKDGSIPIIKKYLAIKTDAEAGAIWDQLHDAFGAEVPKDLFRKIFESRRKTMIAARQWPESKPLPDVEHFLDRSLLESTLKEMKYVPTERHNPKTN
jgi:ABC-type nitrate/sulfonate/bicarbonate transport system substrate-binding protein